MKAAVIIFPGSNCDRDMYSVIEKVTGKQPLLIWHGDSSIPDDVDFIALPGGFSYGDYLRSGAMSAHSLIMQEVIRLANKGVHILGVCNGFQILTEAKLLPGALMRNRDLKFICKNVNLNIANKNTVFTSKYANNDNINIPIAHHDGNYFANDDIIKEIEDNEQIAFTYNENPNGSVKNIAGILSKDKKILGMMPHPERAADAKTGGKDGILLFESIIESI